MKLANTSANTANTSAIESDSESDIESDIWEWHLFGKYLEFNLDFEIAEKSFENIFFSEIIASKMASSSSLYSAGNTCDQHSMS